MEGYESLNRTFYGIEIQDMTKFASGRPGLNRTFYGIEIIYGLADVSVLNPS